MEPYHLGVTVPVVSEEYTATVGPWSQAPRHPDDVIRTEPPVR
jgi:hypothetical protein